MKILFTMSMKNTVYRLIFCPVSVFIWKKFFCPVLYSLDYFLIKNYFLCEFICTSIKSVLSYEQGEMKKGAKIRRVKFSWCSLQVCYLFDQFWSNVDAFSIRKGEDIFGYVVPSLSPHISYCIIKRISIYIYIPKLYIIYIIIIGNIYDFYYINVDLNLRYTC